MLQRLWFGLYSNFRFRACGTPFSIPNVPPFDARRPKAVPSRATFLRHTASRVAKLYLIVRVLDRFRDRMQELGWLNPEMIPISIRWHEVTLNELWARMVDSLLGLSLAVCTLNMLWCMPSFFFVATGLTPVSHWHPMFGPLSKAYTVHNFWE